ncbi:MAG TPA: hypothetical protein VLS89_11285, partial [Candidatus Nanopelagicales bacterium]|nr:hypothetical protein [Candidatus Nanopelagicales bacterium]
MADDYIDYLEVGEYGGGCVTALGRLVGVATLVNVQALQAEVQGAVSGVDQELEKAGIQRSDLRGQRKTVEAAAAEGRKEVEKFHGWLKSLDDNAAVDREAF